MYSGANNRNYMPITVVLVKIDKMPILNENDNIYINFTPRVN